VNAEHGPEIDDRKDIQAEIAQVVVNGLTKFVG
jgi:hypothetical protein